MPPPSSAAQAPILVADTPEAQALLQASLQQGFVLQSAATVQAAKRLLSPGTALVICGCHFDEGRMYELLRYLKSQPALVHVPFLTLRALEGKLEDALYESVKIATQALGGNGFVDLYRWKQRYGEQEARDRLTRCVLALAAGTGDAGAPTTF